MADRIKVLMVAPHLRYGGSAQVVRQLAKYVNRQRFDTHLALLTHSTQETPCKLAGTDLHCLRHTRVLFSLPALCRLVWRLRPDVIFSSMTHLNLALLLMRRILPKSTAIVIRQNGQVDFEKLSWTFWLVKILYGNADCVICQSPAMAHQFNSMMNIDEKRIQVLWNPVTFHAAPILSSQAHSHERHAAPRLIAVGRLSHEKGFDLLLTAMEKVHRVYPRASLTLLGDGPELKSLHAICADLSLQAHVHFAGQVEDPLPYLNSANLFVLPSRTDAMPNALLEAAAAGLPLVATPSSAGLIELLQDQSGVWMAAACCSDALADAILQALASQPAPMRFVHHFLEPFQLARAIDAYEACFVAAQKGMRQ